MTTIGILGGGQLGRMAAHAAQALGVRVVVLDPDPRSPAGAVAERQIVAAYDDAAALAGFAAACDAVTTEFENVPADSLERLAATRPVAPSAAAVRVGQHRAREKRAFEAAGVPCAPWAAIEHAGDLAAAAARAELFPGLLKTSQLGYDGKGQAAVESAAALAGAWQALGGVPCVLERRVALEAECSALVARGRDGRCVHWPVQQNRHDGGVLAVTACPAPAIDEALAAQARDAASRMAQALGYVGVLCVEFFVVREASGGVRLLANEMAPRPHNSGHHTIDSCDLSQFEAQVRALLGWPLPTPRLHSPAVMLNLLGDLWFADGEGPVAEPDWPRVLALPGAHLHLYGKHEARRGRKMGHLTLTASSPEAACAAAAEAARVLGLPPPRP